MGDVHKKKTDYVDFDTYWNKIIILDKEGNTFTRKQIIDAIANQDGGAHVDPELKKEYVDFSRKNSMGWVHSIDDKNWNPVMGAELASVRQIAHEILRTLIPSYPIKKMVCSEIAGPTISTDMKAVYADDILLTEVTKKVGRNELCPCKSGVKYKECCGK